MWQNVKSVIAFMCILVYIGAAAFAGIRIYKSVNEQRFEAQQEFADLTDFAVRAGALGLFTNEYIEDIKTQLDMSKALDALIIYGPNSNRAAFEKKPGLISYKGDYPDFNKQIQFYHIPHTSPLRVEGNLNASISAVSPVINFNTLLTVLRSSLLAILIAVVAAFATLIIDVSVVQTGKHTETPAVQTKTAALTNDSEKKTENSGMPAFNEDDLLISDTGYLANDDAIIGGNDDDGAYSADRPAIAGERSDTETPHELTEPERVEKPDTDREIPFAVAEATPIEIDSLLASTQAETETAESPPEIEPVDETPVYEEPDAETPSMNNGLLAAASAMYEIDNFDKMDDGTEFIDILQQELKKSETADNDITLLSIEWTAPGLETEPLIQQAAAFFKYGSRVFEKAGQDGIYIIAPDSGLDEVFAAAKEFHRQARETRPPDIYAELLIGLSARAERNVNAINFLNEVECALDKAHSDSSLPIVAFKADPKKYKEFTSRHKISA
ncbi:MAG: hypothetical protein LBB22_02785 [Treponema sp.]|jgi:hypothetical protein|nr:hypothetical protein [Treponema sp.]